MADAASEKQPKRQAYYPIYLVKSDGMNFDYESPVLREVPGARLDEEDDLDRTNRDKWEIVLGMFLKDQLADTDDKKEYKLAALPEGYELRGATKTSDPTKKEYFLYGHPLGARNKFRSPNDFFPHLLWLAGDSKDYTDCSCDFCNRLAERERLSRSRSANVAVSAPVPVPAPAPSAVKLPTPSAPSAAAQLPRTAATVAQTQARVPASAPAPAPAPAPTTAPALASAPVPAPAPAAPKSVCPPGTTGMSNIFRLGEMVWYKTKAWRIGVIIDIAVANNNSIASSGPRDDNGYVFKIAPLGHVLLPQESVHKSAPEMRPFLTFSVPATTDYELAGKAFWEIDWQSYTAQLAQEPDERNRNSKLAMAGLEASKMAARAVNDAYSVFNQISSPPGSAGLGYHYTGVFLGAEMIQRGDAVRVSYLEPVAQEPITVTMLVAAIHLMAKDAQPPRSLELVGNLYRLVHGGQESSVPAVDPSTMGPYFAEEVASHNAIDQRPGGPWRWTLLEQNARRAEREVQGRSYVSHKLMRIVDETGFEAARKYGQVMDASSCLNKRPHSGSNGTSHLGCVPNRQDTFGQSIAYKIQLPENIKETSPS